MPDGPYLEQASAEGLAAFEHQLVLLKKAGYTVRHVQALEEIDTINRQHSRLVFAEMAQVHSEWFTHYESLYRPRTASAIREGREVSTEELSILRNSPAKLRVELEALMAQAGIDIWVCPSAPGPAPKGITSTGSPLIGRGLALNQLFATDMRGLTRGSQWDIGPFEFQAGEPVQLLPPGNLRPAQ